MVTHERATFAVHDLRWWPGLCWCGVSGRYRHQVVHADQFSVRVKRGDTVHAQVRQAGVLHPALSVSTADEGGDGVQVLSVEDGSASENLKGWTWGMPGKKGTYHALYPRAWTVYEVSTKQAWLGL